MEEDMDGYLEQVAEYWANTVSARSRIIYRNSSVKYLDCVHTQSGLARILAPHCLS